MIKLKVLLSLEGKTFLLWMEALIYLGWARILVKMPFSKIAPSLGTSMQETSDVPLESNKIVLRRISSAVHVMSKYTIRDSICLVNAIAAMKMLHRRQIESTLYLGTARDESRKMIAHAWLRSGRYYVTGKEGMERFTVVGKFAKMNGK